MAKSMKNLLKEWNNSHNDGLFRGLPVDELRNDYGSKYSVWSAGFEGGSVQIDVDGISAQISVLRIADDPFNNSKFYTFKNYKVFQAALEVVYHTLEKFDVKYTSFEEYADTLEMILDVFPADKVKKNKAKKVAE